MKYRAIVSLYKEIKIEKQIKYKTNSIFEDPKGG